MKKISHQELSEILRSLKGASIVSFTASTVVPMVRKHRQTQKTNPFFGRVVKLARVNGVIGAIYENAVNNLRVKEASPLTIEELLEIPLFHAGPRQWGTRIIGTPLVEHKGELYLEVKVEKVLDRQFLLDGDLQIEEAEIEPYLIHSADREGVTLRDYRLTNLKDISLKGQTYVIREE